MSRSGLSSAGKRMAVYTELPDAELASFLAAYDLGSLEQITGICAGTENSNFFLDTQGGRFVLTIFERLPRESIPYYLLVTEWLSQHGIPCPAPVHSRAGEILGTLCGKPAAIVQRLAGQSIEGRVPNEAEISALGQLLARMHLAGRGFPEEHPNPAGLGWCQETGRRLFPKLSPAERELLADERETQKQWPRDKLPGGVIHADLFPDNVLFQGNTITGTIDYYYAGDDAWLYDLAIVANAWCSFPDGSLDKNLAAILWQAYESVRPFERREHGLWFPYMRAAALRFWLLRLEAKHFPRGGQLTELRDPEEYQRILERRREFC